MHYDDGYEYLPKVEKAEIPEGYTRAHMLGNGDVVQVHGLLLEFEDNILYEVKEPVGLVNPYYERTGRSFTPEQLNEMVRR